MTTNNIIITRKTLYITLFILFSTIANLTFAEDPQNNSYTPTFPNVKVTSPQATQFLRYGDVPVNVNSGVPEISIPIYTIKVGMLEIPITLSYHAGGIRVQDEASIVGLGWVLNAGGIITQKSSDIIDDTPGYPILFKSSAEAEVAKQQACNLAPSTNQTKWEAFTHGCEEMGQFGLKISSDQYFYMFNGNSGVFRYDLSDNILKTVPYTPLKIIKGYNTFEITDTEGNIWFFEKMESVTNNEGYCQPTYEYYLKKIKVANIDQELIFNYEYGITYNKFVVSENVWLNVDRSGSGGCYDCYNCNSSYFTNYNMHKERSLKTKLVNFRQILLKSITWKNLVVSFNYVNDRIDHTPERLDNVEIIVNNNIIKNFQLLNQNKYLGDNIRNHRMLLEGIQDNEKEYYFDYNEDIIPPPYVEQRSPVDFSTTNCHEDFWGYYNGGDSEYWIPFNWSQTFPFKFEREYLHFRESNPDYTQFGILKVIHYPTGGRTEFEYEQNKSLYVYAPDLTNYENADNPIEYYFGGVRIKSIINYETENSLSPLTIKTYEYLNGGPTLWITTEKFVESKITGIFPLKHPCAYNNVLYPSFSWITSVYDQGNGSCYSNGSLLGNQAFNIDKASTAGFAPITEPVSQSVFYNNVVEYLGNETQNTGKTEYVYENGDLNYLNSKYEFLWFEKGIKTPRLISKNEYEFKDGIYKIRKKMINSYKLNYIAPFITGVSIETTEALVNNDYEFIFNQSGAVNFYERYNIHDILVEPSFWQLDSTVDSLFFDNGIVDVVTKYKYDINNRILNPTEKEVKNSNGKITTETYTFPFNYNVEPYSDMVINNILSPIVSQTEYNGNGSKTIKNNYVKINSKFLIDNIENGINGNLEKRIQFHNYDSYCNPIFLSKDNATKIVYLWSYNGQYPIAEIQNATYTEVSNAIPGFINYITGLSYPSDAVINSMSNGLRAGLPNAQVTTYTYKPLVGMTSMTDPRGVTTTYHYDDYNRLQYIKDKDNTIIQSFDYNYKQ